MSVLDKITLSQLRTECIVGIYPHERHTAQPLELALTLYVDTRRAAKLARLAYTVDYAQLWTEVRFILQAGRFLLLETAAEAIAHYILAPPTSDAPRAEVQAVTVCLTKPYALSGAGVPALEIHRVREEMRYDVEATPSGEREVLFTSADAEIVRWQLPPTGTLTLEPGLDSLPLGDALTLDGARPPAQVAVAASAPPTQRVYNNPGPHSQSLLVMRRLQPAS